MAEPSDFKFGVWLGFAKAHRKVALTDKSWGGCGLREAPKNLRFLFNISATAEASDFKCGLQLGFAKVHHKNIPRKKVGIPLC